MRRILVCSLLAVFLLATFTTAASAQEDKQDTYKQLLERIDGSIITLRKGGDPSGLFSGGGEIRELYNDLISGENFEGHPELEELNDHIENNFGDLQARPTEEGIRTLRSNITGMAGELGIGLSFIYEHAMFVILGLSVSFAFLITLVIKYTVDWERVKQAKARMKAWQKGFRAAHRERDMKRVHKLRMEQKEVMQEQKKVWAMTSVSILFYIVPYFLMWWLLNKSLSGWVVTWIPFHLPLPFWGTMVSMGFLPWCIITYFGFAQLCRRFLIGD